MLCCQLKSLFRNQGAYLPPPPPPSAPLPEYLAKDFGSLRDELVDIYTDRFNAGVVSLRGPLVSGSYALNFVSDRRNQGRTSNP